MNDSRIQNFGMNICFKPELYFQPKTEADVLQILASHVGKKIRAHGSKHAWSPLIETQDISIDLSQFNQVEIKNVDGKPYAVIGAGNQIKTILKKLLIHGYTTPSLGLISEQTIAGATSTATHGSGKHSLSHYISSLKIACFDETGSIPQIKTITEGDELKAARCALGCLGIILEITMPVIPIYYVTEKATLCNSMHEIREIIHRAPLSQFYIFPHSWGLFAQERKVAEVNHRQGFAGIYRIYWFLTLDFGMHFFIKLAAAWLKSRYLVRTLFKYVFPLFIFPKWVVTDRSDQQLIMEHELFRHLEIELFVADSKLESAAQFISEILKAADNSAYKINETVLKQLEENNLVSQFKKIRGIYCHHYPICFRRILPDDTLISMTANAVEDWYSISFINYTEPRDHFYELMTFMAQSTFQLYQARIHWGKWFPLNKEEIKSQYPQLELFKSICHKHDPKGVFRNQFIEERLDFNN